MSESTNSSPPSSSLSSPDSDPTSDELPDLGFNQLLREYSHLQPHPRIPIQIRSQTSSTTPTYHAESLDGDDIRARTTSRGAQSTLSTFTRPPTSTVEPDGSTVWDHPFIAPYLPSSTPSNDDELDDDYSASESVSRASTSLTVEIRDLRSFDDQSPLLGFSPEPTSAVVTTNQRLDSLDETPQSEDDISSQDQSDHSPTSIQLQSQVITVASSSSLSLASSDGAGVSVSIAGLSGPSSINSRIDGTLGRPTSSESTSTLMNVFLNRSRNPIPPRTVSDSSYSTTTRSSAISLISYQLPESPSVADLHPERSDSEHFSHLRLQPSTASASTTLSSLAFSAAQRSFNSHSNLSVPVTDATLPNPHSLPAPSPLTNPHSLAAPSPLTNPHSLPAASPTLTNPYSSIATPDTALRPLMPNDQLMSPQSRQIAVVDDLDTPYNPPSEAILYGPSRRIFEPVRDDENEARPRFSDQPFGSCAF